MRITPPSEAENRTHIDFTHVDEKCLLFFRKHGIYLFFGLTRYWLLAVVTLVAIMFLRLNVFDEADYGILASNGFLMIVMAYMLIVIHTFFLTCINYFLDFIMVTNKRVIEVHKTAFLRDEMDEIPFDFIRAIHHEKRGILANILDYGTLNIESNVYQRISMHFIPHSDKKATKISEIHGDYIGIPERANNREEG